MSRPQTAYGRIKPTVHAMLDETFSVIEEARRDSGDPRLAALGGVVLVTIKALYWDKAEELLASMRGFMSASIGSDQEGELDPTRPIAGPGFQSGQN